MKLSKLLLVTGALIILTLGILIVKFSANEDAWVCLDGEWQKHGNPTMDMPVAECENLNEININFTKTGYISDREPGKPNEGMYLIYEEPGKPALSAKMKFDEKSVCEFAEEKVACISINSAIEKVAENKRVEINGFEYGGIVLIKNLIIRE